MEEKLLDISVQLNLLESMSRILLEALRNDDNLKSFDIENLALVLLNNVIKIKNDMNQVEEFLKI